MTSPSSVSDTRPLADAQVHGRRRLSTVWLIPLVAAILGGWLAYKTISEQGPTIHLAFETAAGLEAGKTKIKYKDVEVGLVDSVVVNEDLSKIAVTASVEKAFERHLTTATRFWVVRPRVGQGGVSGLDTLVSGAFIEVDPGPGEPAFDFTGLEEPPLIRSDVPGTEFVLESDHLGSVSRGAPILYRGIEVGQVLGHELGDDQRSLRVFVFVRSPYDQLVRRSSHFWNVSGLGLETSADGVQVHMGTLQSVLIGGIEFDTPLETDPEPAPAETAFILYPDPKSLTEAQFTRGVPFLVHFDGSVRGLEPGATVEMRGIKLGVVREVSLSYDRVSRRFNIPVVIELQPDRVVVEGNRPRTAEAAYDAMAGLIKQGLRAQLATGSLITGQLLVELDMHPDAQPADLGREGVYPQIPSIPTTLDTLTASVDKLLSKFAALPIDRLMLDLQAVIASADRLIGSPETQATVANVGEAASSVQSFLGGLGASSGPLIDAMTEATGQANGTLASVDSMIGSQSNMRHELNVMLQEFGGAARAVRQFAEYLERNPQALLRGK